MARGFFFFLLFSPAGVVGSINPRCFWRRLLSLPFFISTALLLAYRVVFAQLFQPTDSVFIVLRYTNESSPHPDSLWRPARKQRRRHHPAIWHMQKESEADDADPALINSNRSAAMPQKENSRLIPFCT